MDLRLGIFGSLYAAGGLLTLALVFKTGSRRLFKWLKANRPETVEDWVFTPVLAVLAVGMVGVGVWFTLAAWPVVAWVVYHERQRGHALRRTQADSEDRELLEEVRQLKRLGDGEGCGTERGQIRQHPEPHIR